MAEKKKTTTKKTNKEKLEEVTTGMEPIVGVKPTVEIEGKTYTIRRLGIPDMFTIVRILGIGIKQLSNVRDIQSMDRSGIALALIAAIPSAEDEVMDLLADIVGVDGATIRNPELFPVYSVIDIVEALSEHQDLKAFFTALQGLVASNPALQKAMEEATAEEQSSEQ